MTDLLLTSISFVADASAAVSTMREYVTPTVHILSALAAVVCTFFIVNSGFLYMTSAGQPEKMDHAKHTLRSAVIGLVLVLGAATFTAILSHAYGSPAHGATATLPSLQPIPAEHVSNGLVDVLIKAVTGLLNNIIQAVAAPFLGALNFFTKETPLMADNAAVFNLWLGSLGIANVLFILVIVLIGFHVMSAASFGFDEIEFKHLLPRIGLIFLLMNTSIFLIDGIIELSNAMIKAITAVSGASSVWDTLTAVVKSSGGESVAALLVMLAFLIFSVFLVVYYILRLITLFIGTVLAPFVILLWLIPGFRDFSETAIKTYLTTIFVLFVHVVILLLSAALFAGMVLSSDNHLPDTIMAMVAGLATVLALLKTQGVMMQFSYMSGGARNARQLGGQFMNGVSYMTGKGKAAASTVASKTDSAKQARAMAGTQKRALQTGRRQTISYANKKGNAEITYSVQPNAKSTPRVNVTKRDTGTTYEAPKVTPLKDNGKIGKDNS